MIGMFELPDCTQKTKSSDNGTNNRQSVTKIHQELHPPDFGCINKYIDQQQHSGEYQKSI
jgi:hypothetical protein